MLYLLAILLPPVALLLCGKPVQAVLSLALIAVSFLWAWPLCSLWALFVVANHLAEKRNKALIRAVQAQAPGAPLPKKGRR